MEQLPVLAGEPLLVIDFRYHLVSLIAVFLAVALGIVIGTTQLNGRVVDNLNAQVGSLEQDKRGLEAQNQQIQAQLGSDESFAQAVAPALVSGTLRGRKVLLVLTSDQVPSGTVDAVDTLVHQAAGTVSGTIHLQPQYTDPASASGIENYVTGSGRPAGIQLPQTDDPHQLVAALLAEVLLAPSFNSSANTSAISSVLAGLSALDVLAQDSATVSRADYAIVLTAGALDGTDVDKRNAALVDLAAALDAGGSGAVVAGDTASAGSGGLVGAVRNDPTVSAAVSTVDNVGSAVGQLSTVLALGRERQGTSGKYGTGSDTQPVPPVAGATR
jgi:Copper transport outer membrane protein, MctB